jgi:PAS domain S-box-containing protein
MSTASGEELERFFTLSLDLFCIAGFDGYFKRLNPRWSRTLGFSLEELLGRPLIEFIHPDDREATQIESEKLIRGEETVAFENRYLCKDGSYKWLLWNAAAVSEQQLIYATARDVTRRRRAEDESRRTQKFLDSIVENIPNMVFVKDAKDLRFILQNKMGQQMIGHTQAEMLGKSDHDFFPKEEADFFTAKDRAVLASGQMLDIPEEPLETPMGLRYLHTKKIPVLDEDGSPLYLLGISEDITERKRADEQLREQNIRLQELARSEREAHEALKKVQIQMIQSEKLAALGQLVAGVAHEINNPLAFVSNNVAVMKREFGPLRDLLELYRSADAVIAERAPQTMKRISELAEPIDLPYVLSNLPELLSRSRDGLSRIQRIVADLREFARQETVGDTQHGVDLNSGIESTLNILHGRAKRSGVELRTQLGSIPSITCNPGKINQVVMNLVANAIDACGTSGAVTVSTAAGNGGVEMRVADNGCGIPQEILEKIFDPFFTTKPQGQGTGLGLSISHGIVREHGGKIAVQSEPGKGTCFIVTLPLAPPPPKTKEQAIKAGG